MLQTIAKAITCVCWIALYKKTVGEFHLIILHPATVVIPVKQ